MGVSGSMSLWSLPVPSCHYIWTIRWWIVQSSTLNSHLTMVSLHLEIVAKAWSCWSTMDEWPLSHVTYWNEAIIGMRPLLEWGHYEKQS
jgi:hypothetical protein